VWPKNEAFSGRRPRPERGRTWPRRGLTLAVVVLAAALFGVGAAKGQRSSPVPSPPGPPDAATQALNAQALEVLHQIRQAYPVDFGEEPAIHRAVRAHLIAGKDPTDVRHLVKAAVVQGCRQACMRAAMEAFTKLNEAGIAASDIQEVLVTEMKAARHEMPRQYTYEMLGKRLTERVDRREGAVGVRTP
jgi:hypothetical protein